MAREYPQGVDELKLRSSVCRSSSYLGNHVTNNTLLVLVPVVPYSPDGVRGEDEQVAEYHDGHEAVLDDREHAHDVGQDVLKREAGRQPRHRASHRGLHLERVIVVQ